AGTPLREIRGEPAQAVARDEEARPRRDSAPDLSLELAIDPRPAPLVDHGRDADPERGERVPARDAEARRVVEVVLPVPWVDVGDIVADERDVRVGVDEAGEPCIAGPVDDARRRRDAGGIGAHVRNAVALDED